jgi:Spy/CpxP family protein refolding chaperone
MGVYSLITINLSKAKTIAHEIRRQKRSQEFATLDIQATIPAYAAQAEAARQEIRDRYAQMQIDIDAANTPEQLKQLIS